jgi:hypothetical protein
MTVSSSIVEIKTIVERLKSEHQTKRLKICRPNNCWTNTNPIIRDRTAWVEDSMVLQAALVMKVQGNLIMGVDN